MNNKAHTILVSIISSYGSRLTASTANCKAFLADLLTEYPEEKDVLVELHKLQLTKVLSSYQGGSIDRKSLFQFFEKLKSDTSIAQHNLAWGVDAWANTLSIDIKSRRLIRKQCFPNSERDLHLVTIRAAEVITDEMPEVPPVVIENANQAALPRVAFLGVATLVSTFSIFQAVKSMLPSDSVQAPARAAIEKVVAVESTPIVTKTPIPKLVVIKDKDTEVTTKSPTSRMSYSQEIIEEPQHVIDIEKLSGTTPKVLDAASAETEETVAVAAADTTKVLPLTIENDTLHSDIESFLIQN